jgi:hypothetical protein
MKGEDLASFLGEGEETDRAALLKALAKLAGSKAELERQRVALLRGKAAAESEKAAVESEIDALLEHRAGTRALVVELVESMKKVDARIETPEEALKHAAGVIGEKGAAQPKDIDWYAYGDGVYDNETARDPNVDPRDIVDVIEDGWPAKIRRRDRRTIERRVKSKDEARGRHPPFTPRRSRALQK